MKESADMELEIARGKPATPIKVMKPRDVSATKKSTVVPMDALEFSTEFASIERALNTYRIGTFKVFFVGMTFK